MIESDEKTDPDQLCRSWTDVTWEGRSLTFSKPIYLYPELLQTEKREISGSQLSFYCFRAQNFNVSVPERQFIQQVFFV